MAESRAKHAVKIKKLEEKLKSSRLQELNTSSLAKDLSQKDVSVMDTGNCSSFDYIAEPSKTISGFANKQIFIYCLLNDKKYAQKVRSKDLVYKKPFGYRVIHQNSLTSCQGLK